MNTESNVLFVWAMTAIIVIAICSIIGAYFAPEVCEARAYHRAVHLAATQPARRRKRLKNV